VFDIATINENKAEWQEPDPAVLATYPPDSEMQQAALNPVRDLDGFNWGYDPFHYTVPEGSYSTHPDGVTRIIEFREMVQALNQMGLRVVVDVVYNHTNASGQAEKSVLDKIVPGYYHRLNDKGVGRNQHLLRQYRQRAQHDGKADDRLAGDLGQRIQGGCLPL
jgi:pullulanase